MNGSTILALEYEHYINFGIEQVEKPQVKKRATNVSMYYLFPWGTFFVILLSKYVSILIL